jgi:hypothetical protein
MMPLEWMCMPGYQQERTMKKNDTSKHGAGQDPITPGEAGTAQDSTRNTPQAPAPFWTGSRGQHIRTVVLEAIGVLRSEGYWVGRLDEPELPFDLVGILDKAIMFVRVVRAKHPVDNALGVAHYFRDEILKIQPFWHHDSDNYQFWVFSKVSGLLRYRVYRGGIWNEVTRKAPEKKKPGREQTGLKMRTGQGSAGQTGHVYLPDGSPA